MRLSAMACAALFAACGDDPHPAKDAAVDSSDDTAVDSSDDTAVDSADDTAVDSADDTAVDSAADTAADSDDPDAYLQRCESLFAARVLEKQIDADATFPNDCGVPLRDPIGRLSDGGKPLCDAGESANACRTRLYETPPSLADLSQACLDTHAPGCMRAAWLARCADGSDDCAEPEAVCHDGTRPMVFVQAATTGPSDVWHFHMGGEGGPCTGGMCWFNYRFSHIGSDAAFEKAMSTSHPDYPPQAASIGGGVMSGVNPPFSSINRVQFERCTDGATHATETVPIGDGVPAELAAQFPGVPILTKSATTTVWHRGFDTWLAAFHRFTTPAGRDLDGDGTPDLPSLADARMVIISGSSDASTWVKLSADRLAAELRAIAGADVDVRVMIDGNFPPTLDNSGRYADGAAPDFDGFRDTYGETGLCRLPDNHDGVDNEACSNAGFSPGGATYESYTARGVLLDESCEAMHGARAPECFDAMHTLYHHISVPILILSDQEDNTISNGPPAYADDRSYAWDGPTGFRQPVLDTARDLDAGWPTDAREEGAGTPGDLVLVLPKERREGQPWGRATHVRFGSNEEMQNGMTLCGPAGNEIRSGSFAAIIGGWLEGALPLYSAIEDAARPLANGAYWVTGAACRAPE